MTPFESGQYLLVSVSPSELFSLVLRLDIAYGSATRGFVSCDLYAGILSKEVDTDTEEIPSGTRFLGSFRASALSAEALAASATTLDVTMWLQSSPPINVGLQVALRAHEQEVGPSAVVAFLGDTTYFGMSVILPTSTIGMSISRISEMLHTLALQFDRTASAADPYSVIAPVTRQISVGRTTLVDCFAEASISVVQVAGDTNVSDDIEWTMDKLKTAAGVDASSSQQIQSSFLRDQKMLAAYMIIVPHLSNGNGGVDRDTMGVMFDYHDRRGCAVFHQSLKDAFSNGEEVSANYLFTLVHEVGHCLNLPHVFDQRRLSDSDGFRSPGTASPTFMNYPQEYQGRGERLGQTQFTGRMGWPEDSRQRYTRFWSDFDFLFDPRELLELRHGPRDSILTGDGAASYRGDFANPNYAMGIGGDSGRGIRLELRARGTGSYGGTSLDQGPVHDVGVPMFDFGEPVHVEAKLTNLLAEEREFADRLSLSGGGLCLSYETPNGKCRIYEPPCQFSQMATAKVLNADPASTDQSSFYKDLSLSFSGAGFPFAEPGRYRLRAAYRYHDTMLISNILTIHIRYPDRQVEDLIVPLLDVRVSEYFAFRGVNALDSADRLLQYSFGDKPIVHKTDVHPLWYYYCAYEARMRAQGSVKRDRNSRRLLKANRSGTDSVSWFLAAFNLTSRSALRGPTHLEVLPFSNIELAKLGRIFHSELLQEDPKLAVLLRRRLESGLTARGVASQSMRDRYLPPPLSSSVDKSS